MGNLVTLLGANNSGKSNALAGVQVFGRIKVHHGDELSYHRGAIYTSGAITRNGRGLDYSDVCDLFSCEECKNPKITLSCKNDAGKKIFSYTKERKVDEREVTHSIKLGEAVLEDALIGNIKGRNGYIVSGFLLDNKLLEEFRDFETKYGYSALPKIVRYENKDISSKELNIYLSDGELKINDFFPKLFKSVGIEKEAIIEAYKNLAHESDRGKLRQIDGKLRALENELNKGLETVSQKFNALFHTSGNADSYTFKLYLDRDGLGLSLSRGGHVISIDRQSDGFKWFFNFFFNLLCTTELNPGDIIIMDEPATNLHVKGQRELLLFLRNFVVQNGITVVIATHSPFLIDLDFLDEIRLVVADDDGTSHFENSFAAVDPDDPDSLLAIKEALTIENYILVNPNEKVVFVEGITDYNYLTAFKRFLGKTGISFLPINGVGRTEEQCLKISGRLRSIRRDAFILVDNDEAGNRMKNLNKDSDFTVRSLGDIDAGFKTIESLFTHDDLAAFGLLDENGAFIKHASTSSVFKNRLLRGDESVSDETKSNFEKLFDKICEELS